MGNPAMMVDPWGLDGELSNPLIPNAIVPHTGPPPTSYTLPTNFQLHGLPYMQGASEQQGRFTLGASSKQATTQYTTQELSNSFQFRTVTELANGDFAFTTYLSDIRDPNKLVLAVFSQADGTWTVLVPEYENNMQRDQANAIRRAEAVDDLKYVMVGVIAAPIIIAGAVEIAPLAVAAMPSFSLWGGGSATTSVLGGGGGLLAPKVIESLSSPTAQSTVYTVYQVVQNGAVRYVGITANFARRSAEHLSQRGWKPEKLIDVAGRETARAVEQVLIETHGLAKHGGTLLNKINSIAASNPVYDQAVRLGKQILGQE